MAEDINRCEADDPNRCQAVTPQGQCLNKSVEGVKYCKCHGGARALSEIKKAGLQNYRITKYNARLNEFSDSSAIKSLRDEIAILRMILEERLNRCKDETDLMMESQMISELILKIEKVVSSCHKLEGSMGTLLDKQVLIQFAVQIIDVIATEVKDEAALSRISDGILSVIQNNE